MVQVQHRRDLSSVDDDHSNLSSMVPWISSITSTLHKAGGREEAAAALNGGERTRRQALRRVHRHAVVKGVELARGLNRT